MRELVSGGHSNTFDHVKLVESYRSLDPDLSDYIVSFAFGDIYSRTSLTQQEQTLVTISTLVGVGTGPHLKLHINTGFNVGLTKEKIVGALIHCIPYVGFPRVLNGLTLLKEVFGRARPQPGSGRGVKHLPAWLYRRSQFGRRGFVTLSCLRAARQILVPTEQRVPGEPGPF